MIGVRRTGARLPVLHARRPRGAGHAAEDLTGQPFGLLTVSQRAPNSARQKARWVCRCACGRLRVLLGGDLRSGRVASCGVCARSPESAPESAPAVGISPPPPSQPRQVARMLPMYEATRGHSDRAEANRVALAHGVERRHTCDRYDACLDHVPHASVDARCPRECPGYELSESETREARLLAATARTTFDTDSLLPCTRGLALGRDGR